MILNKINYFNIQDLSAKRTFKYRIIETETEEHEEISETSKISRTVFLGSHVKFSFHSTKVELSQDLSKDPLSFYILAVCDICSPRSRSGCLNRNKKEKKRERELKRTATTDSTEKNYLRSCPDNLVREESRKNELNRSRELLPSNGKWIYIDRSIVITRRFEPRGIHLPLHFFQNNESLNESFPWHVLSLASVIFRGMKNIFSFRCDFIADKKIKQAKNFGKEHDDCEIERERGNLKRGEKFGRWKLYYIYICGWTKMGRIYRQRASDSFRWSVLANGASR